MSRFNSKSSVENNEVRGIVTLRNVPDFMAITEKACTKSQEYDINALEEVIRTARKTITAQNNERSLAWVRNTLLKGCEVGDILRPWEVAEILGKSITIITAILNEFVKDGIAATVRIRVNDNRCTYAYKIINL